MRSSIPVLLLATLLAGAPAGNAEARKPDREQPMEVRSDRQSGGLGEDDTLVLTGNVEIRQGSLAIAADRATVERRDGEIARIVLDGTPVRMSQLTGRGEPVDARAARVTYTPGAEDLLLSGQAVVTQPRGTLEAETIRYNLDTGAIDSGGDGNRVRMTIQPRTAAARP
ncbi:MAG: lipopolysaccharide transport periplasmic protein LptA [Xanthomonadaceae bacterium]|jgi:lipopolysaccharide export system protein LptA|nr:lipopolysaccharide transport periplasmic protein LptA [Xanthomonadaceae bacterium]